jgi:hypothetical protein
VVEHPTHNLKIQGLNPAAGFGRDKKKRKIAMPSSTVVAHLTHNPKFQGLNPATGMVGEKIKKYSVVSQ